MRDRGLDEQMQGNKFKKQSWSERKKTQKKLQLISPKIWEGITTIEQGEIIRKRNKEPKLVLLRMKNITLEMKKRSVKE